MPMRFEGRNLNFMNLLQGPGPDFFPPPPPINGFPPGPIPPPHASQGRHNGKHMGRQRHGSFCHPHNSPPFGDQHGFDHPVPKHFLEQFVAGNLPLLPPFQPPRFPPMGLGPMDIARLLMQLSAPSHRFGNQNVNRVAHPVEKTSSTSSIDTNQKCMVPRHPELFKTTLCDYFMGGLACRFGDRCWYAHGMQELRKPSENKDYRAEELSHQGGFSLFGGSSSNSIDLVPIDKKDSGKATRSTSTVSSSLPSVHSLGPIGSGRPGALAPRLPEGIKATHVSRHSLSSTSDGSGSSAESIDEEDFELADLVDTGVCDMFAISGFCVMGDQCIYEHKCQY